MSTSLDTLNEVNKYLAYVFVTILTLTLAFVLVKLRFKLDLRHTLYQSLRSFSQSSGSRFFKLTWEYNGCLSSHRFLFSAQCSSLSSK